VPVIGALNTHDDDDDDDDANDGDVVGGTGSYLG